MAEYSNFTQIAMDHSGVVRIKFMDAYSGGDVADVAVPLRVAQDLAATIAQFTLPKPTEAKDV